MTRAKSIEYMSKSKSNAAVATKQPAVVSGDSPIHGKGLFANRTLRKGERIGAYEGPRTKRNGPYVLWVDDEDEPEIYGLRGTNDLRYVNHSSKPNAVFIGEELWALKKIEPGAEILHDYGDEWHDLG